MAIPRYQYSEWDGSQAIPDFTAEELLENMSDDLLRGGDPERALRTMLRRGFRLPDGRRFQGTQRLLQQMREYRREATRRYDPNGVVDRVREQLDAILRMEREAIERRRRAEELEGQPQGTDAPQGSEDLRASGQDSQDSGQGGPQRTGQPGSSRPEPGQRAPGNVQPSGQQSPDLSGGSEPGVGQQTGGRSGPPQSGNGQASQGSGGVPEEFRRMLEQMLERKTQQLDGLPRDNAGRIRGLREYDFLSPEAREAFEQLVGGMQRELLDQFFQGLKQGIGQITPEQMDAIRQMVRDLNEMLEAARNGDTGAFERFMQQYGDHFPPGINSLDDLLEHLQRQAAAMQSLLDSMDPEQRAELQAMMEELLRDDRLRMDLARLGANLSAMGYAPNGQRFPFRGDEAPGFGDALDMMRRLQAMQDLENGMMGGDPFNAMAEAGGMNPSELFGQDLGGQIEAVRDMAESLLEAGYLQRDGDRLLLTARAIRKIGDASLREIFRKLKEDRGGGHVTPRRGQGGDITEESRPYQFGDPFHVDIKRTIMNGVYSGGTGTPVRLAPDDFAIFETERAVQHATVLALDMSHSMYLNGLFLDAKKTALALDSLIRGQFPRDALYLVGFHEVAFELQQEDLPLLSEADYRRGTNYEMALALARRLLARHRGGNRQILFVTDGEPTACRLPGGQVYFNWPPRPFVYDSALEEAQRCAKDGIVINTFALDPDPGLVAFVEEMTEVNHGRMFMVGSHHLGQEVVLDYLQGRSVRRLQS